MVHNTQPLNKNRDTTVRPSLCGLLCFSRESRQWLFLDSREELDVVLLLWHRRTTHMFFLSQFSLLSNSTTCDNTVPFLPQNLSKSRCHSEHSLSHTTARSLGSIERGINTIGGWRGAGKRERDAKGELHTTTLRLLFTIRERGGWLVCWF